jgi:RHS repeat-associated protein
VVLRTTDFSSVGFGVPWGHTRSFASQLTATTNAGNGNNWQIAEWPYLAFPSSTTVVVMGRANGTLWFDLVGGAYAPRFGVRLSLLLDTVNNVYRLVDLDGTVSVFGAASGAFQGRTDPAGNSLAVVSYTANGFNFTEVQRTYSAGGNTTVESYLYTYQDPTQTYPLLSGVLLRRQINGGAWTNVTQVLYTYYGSGEPYGNPGDLKTVQTQTWSGTAWVGTGTTYYRYYLAPGPSSSSSAWSSSSSGSSGPTVMGDLLKYAVLPASYDLLSAVVGNPLTATDAKVAAYADYYFAYDSTGRVTAETVEGGGRTYQFAFAQSGNAPGYNSWCYRTTETRPDGSQIIVYSNYAGQTMLTVLQSAGQQWCDFYQYSSDGLLILHASPSAVSGFSEQYADLLHDVGGNYQYLNDHAGLVRTYSYHAPSGFLSSESLQQGELGIPILLRQYQYVACYPTAVSSSSSSGSSSSRRSSSSSSSSGAPAMLPTYFLSQEIVYPDDPAGCPGASSSSSSSSGQPRQVVTSYSYVWYPGTCQVQQRTTTLPLISAFQNGSGVAATTGSYYDTYGNLIWHKDERGFLTNSSLDIVTGALTQRIEDVDTVLLSAPAGWTTPAGGGLHLVTDYQFDSRGRTTQELGPTHTISLNGVATSIRRAVWTVYQDGLFQTWTAEGYATGTSPNYSYMLINPVSIEATDSTRRPTMSIRATRASPVGALQPTDSYPQTSYVRWTTLQYADGFHLSSRRVYKLIPASGTGVSGTNFDETDIGYDELERQNRFVTPGGTVTRKVYDVRGNSAQLWIGTNDTGATISDPSGGGAPGNDMAQVTVNQYDNGQAGGDNNLTQTTQYVDSSTSRVTIYLFDWRNRRTDIDGEIDFYEQRCYDNLNRVIRIDRRNTTAAGNLVARSQALFDDRGHVYKTVRYGVNPATGLVGNPLTDNTWYDATGNVLKKQIAGAQTFTKSVTDGAGRVITSYTGYNLTDSSYANAGSVATDTILEQGERVYDPAGNLIQVTNRQRYHNATGIGPLGSPSSPQPQARVTYTAIWYDALGRVVAEAEYGTNGGTPLSRPPTPPASSASVLVSTTTYDAAGEQNSMIDPMGIATFYTYDAAGRELQRIYNYRLLSSSSSSSSSWSSASSVASSSSNALMGPCPLSDDTNKTVLTAYNADGKVTSITSENSATGNQMTQYVYGSTLASSGIASSLLKVADVYPDSVGGSDQVTYTYNRQGQVSTVSDQNGTVHSYIYDLLGRLTQDRVTSAGTGIDTTVLRLQTAYDVRGLITGATAYDNATPGSGNVVNDVQLVYNSFGQLVADYQSHGGPVNLGSTPAVQYGYADGNANTIRQTITIYPNGRVLTYDYGAPGGMNDVLSRTNSLIDNDGATHLADYAYLGTRDVIQVTAPQPALTYTLIGVASGNDPVTGDIYQGLDLFGRVKDLIWTGGETGRSSSSSSSSSGGSAAILVRIQHSYDQTGNRLWRLDAVDPTESHDELYTYDGLYRLKNVTRGNLTSDRTSVSPKTFAQCWSLDSTANWQIFREDINGDGIWDLAQTRSANTANEITTVASIAGPSWATPAYDSAGNMTSIPQPGTPSQAYKAIFDAWNRVLRLSVNGAAIAAYQYDALHRRAVQQTFNNGILTETRHVYLSERWQSVEERIGTASTAERHSVFGLRSTQDIVIRDRDTSNGGVLTERLYALQDDSWSVAALCDGHGLIQERFYYDAYGTVAVLTPSFAPRQASLVDWRTLFCGCYWDSTTSLYYMQYRYYNPLIGTFTSRDPAFVSAGYGDNVYAYVNGNPTNVIDPTGLNGGTGSEGLFNLGLTNCAGEEGEGCCCTRVIITYMPTGTQRAKYTQVCLRTCVLTLYRYKGCDWPPWKRWWHDDVPKDPQTCWSPKIPTIPAQWSDRPGTIGNDPGWCCGGFCALTGLTQYFRLCAYGTLADGTEDQIGCVEYKIYCSPFNYAYDSNGNCVTTCVVSRYPKVRLQKPKRYQYHNPC